MSKKIGIYYGKRSPRLYKTILRVFSITGVEEGHIWAVFERSSYFKADGVFLKPTLWSVDNVKSSKILHIFFKID